VTPRSILAGALGVLAVVFPVAAPQASAAPRCGSAAAAQLEGQLPVTPYNLGRRLGETLCFDLTGDGRRDIVFTGWEFMNHGAHYWAAFRATANGWRRMKFKRSCCRADPRAGVGLGLHRGGRTLIVRQPNYEPDDAACCPTGGTDEGRWRWRRGRLELVRVATRPSDS
jgi:hypothetical protein